MSTRSNIGIKKLSGEIETIYCHWDGNIEHHGPILLEHYNTEEKVRELISLGDSSILGSKCNPTSKHSFEHPEEDVTIAYHRDRGEWYEKPSLHSSISQAMKHCPSHLYIYDCENSEWLYCYGGKIHSLQSELMNLRKPIVSINYKSSLNHINITVGNDSISLSESEYRELIKMVNIEKYYIPDIEQYFEESDEYDSSILENSQLINEIVMKYADLREQNEGGNPESMKDWRECIEEVCKHFEDRLNGYIL